MPDLSRRAAILAAAALPLAPTLTRAATGGAATAASAGPEITTHRYANKGGQDLSLDVIVDRSAAFAGPRPVILYSFGGGWETGDRGTGDGTAMWQDFLSLGYAIVAIDYRLGIRDAKQSGDFTEANGTQMYLRAIDWAVEDLFDATAFVVAHADEWGLDQAQIVTLGGSSGATNSLVAEYHAANGTPFAKAHLPEGFRYAGVIAMAGAFWLPPGSSLTFASKPAPIMFFHGAKDWLVTYDEVQGDFAGYGPAYYFRTFAGPEYPKWFVDYPEGDHILAGLPIMNRRLEMRAFLERLVRDRKALSIHTIEESAIPSSFEGLMQQQAGQ